MNTLQELTVDAARYRWLREHINHFASHEMMSYDDSGNVEAVELSPEEVDVIVDEAVEDGWCGDE